VSKFAEFDQGIMPQWALVRYSMDPTEITDVAAAVSAAFNAMPGAIKPGQRVCLTAGSRGIDRIDEVMKAAVDTVRRMGGLPFIIPAMGSHGGATPEGQLEVLRDYGITPESMGCEIRSSMETVLLGHAEGDVPVYFDRNAYEGADVVIPIGRVKPHTDFHGPTESGLLKMIAIGLGKQKGAETFHSRGFHVFHRLIPAVGLFTLSKVNIPFGVALVENGFARLWSVEAVPADRIWEREQELLKVAREQMGRIPVNALDVLMVDYLGKDISGLGMDSNVVGRYYTGPTGEPPAVERIIVRDLTLATEGNATGLGMADVVLSRAVAKMDKHKTYMNCITAKTPIGAQIPITVDTDREALTVAMACCLNLDRAKARIVRIRDTKHVELFYASESLLPELMATGRCEVVEPVHAMKFDTSDMLAERDV